MLIHTEGNMGFVCCVCKESQFVVPNIDTNPAILGEQAELPHQLDVSATLADDPALVDNEQFETGTFPFNETNWPENEQSFEIQEEQLQNISLEDETNFFKKKGVRFVHLNCNILLSKLMKLGNLSCIVNPTLYVFQKQNLTQLLPVQKF